MSTKGIICCIAALCGILLLATPAAAQLTIVADEREAPTDERLESLIKRLEMGMSALEELERRDALEILQRIANEVRQKRANKREVRVTARERERKSGRGLDSLATRIEIIRYARDAFAEAGDKRNAKVLEGVVHYGELALGEANEKQLGKAAEAVPSKANLVEYMNGASNMYKEWGRQERAGACRRLAEYYAQQLQAERREDGEEREVERERGRTKEGRGQGEKEHKQAMHQIEIMKSALGVLKEGGKEDAADILKRAIQARIVNLEGMKGEEANIVRERNPALENQVEVLGLASRLCREWGNKEKAKSIGGLAEQMWGQRKERIAKQKNAEVGHIRKLEEKIAHMTRQIEELKHALREAKREN